MTRKIPSRFRLASGGVPQDSHQMRTPAFILIVALFHFITTGHAEPKVANRFEKEIATYEAADKTSPPPQGGVLFTGASGIRMWKTLAEDFPGVTVVNRGFGGSQLSDSVEFVDRIVVPYHPKTIVIQAGGNDINSGKSPEQVLADFQTWVAKVRAALPKVRLIYLSQGPSPLRWAQREKQQQANQLVREFIAKGENMAFVDIWAPCIGADGQPRPELFIADRLHPSAEQYQIRAKLIRAALE